MRALPWQCFPDSLLFSALDVWLTPTQSASFNQPTYQVCFVVAVEYKKRQYKQLPLINVYLYYKNVVYFVFPHNQTLYLLRSLYAHNICACYWCLLDFGTCFSFIHSLFAFSNDNFWRFCCVMLMLKFEKRLQFENCVRVKEHEVHLGNMYYIPTYVYVYCRQDCQINLFFWLGEKRKHYLQEDLNFH